MSKMIRLSALALAAATVAGFSGSALAATGTANASATILTPISITKDVDLAFGDVYPDSGTAGTVTIDAAGVRTVGSPVALGATPGAAAQFTVSGEASAAYSITLPSAAVTLSDGGGNNMTVDSFTTDGTGTLDVNGDEVIKVGATLNVGANQAAGTYSGTFDVIVNYN